MRRRRGGLPLPRRFAYGRARNLPSYLSDAMTAQTDKQLLHLVMGGRVKDPQTLEFADLDAIEVVGIFPNYAAALEAWRGAAQRTVDDAEMKYVIVHLHKLLQPE